MFVPKGFFLLSALAITGRAYKYDPDFVDYNLNTNQDATNPLDYTGTWDGHTYNPSPDNWRFPFYTLFLDRFVNGDPTNDNANGTVFEQEVLGTQLRFGGDIQGLVDSLDYIQGMGIKGLYVAGSPFINQPWAADSYSPLDHTLLDLHFGNITAWRNAINEIHERGMYIILDNTVATMGDLIGFKGYLNKSAPYVPEHEHEALWKAANGRRYHDFDFGTEFNSSCENFPKLFWDNGSDVQQSVYDTFGGCYNGDFDQFGDTEAFGVYADYRRQLTKFASVQDRLREWVPDVLERLSTFSCLTIQMLDIDGFRYDKATQVTVDAEGSFSAKMRECARGVNKTNFFIPGEITGGNTFGAVYLGRGRQPDQYLDNIQQAVNMTNVTAAEEDVFIRDQGQNALDGAAFHYSIYRNLLRFLGMDGSMEAAYDLEHDWVEAWNKILVSNDMINAETGLFDPRHMFGVVNQDVFRWPAITYGVQRNLLGLFITTMLMPGIPLLLWGEEQAYYVLDNTASNYMFGRQPIAPGPAWQAHGCYALPATLYYEMPLNQTLVGCEDETVSYDHRDPSHPMRNVIKHMYFLREHYPILTDGFYLLELSKDTEMLYLPGSSGVGTETGLWSTMRNQFLDIQDLGEDATPIWLLYHNRNATRTYSFDCTNNDSALIAPFDEGTTVKNLFFPHDELELTASPSKLGINGSTEYNGCYDSVTLDMFEFRAYVPIDDWVPPPAMVTKFVPGHDHRYLTTEESNEVHIEIHMNTVMDCDAFTDAISFVSITESNITPQIVTSTVNCSNITTPEQPDYVGVMASAWSWSANVSDLAQGIHQIVLKNATTADLASYTNSVDRFLIRVGQSNNPVVFPVTSNYSTTLLTKSDSGDLTLSHTAPGASWFRYSTNWGSTYSAWKLYENTSTISELDWSGTSDQEWSGTHVTVQYWSQLLGSSSYQQEGDLDYDGPSRRFPHIWASGPFNQYGYDAGLSSEIKHTAESLWEWHYMDEWPAYFQLSVWGMNPDGQPDQSFVYGDVDGDGVLDRMPPSSLTETDVNITSAPAKPHLAYRLVIQDSTLKYGIVPVGNMWLQLVLYILLWIVPILSGVTVVETFKRSFYKVKFNEVGVGQGSTLALLAARARSAIFSEKDANVSRGALIVPGAAGIPGEKRKRVLIATMEYNIDDWGIKIKIGGLGVMAQLMGTALKHQDLVWVVPCVGGIDYPVDERVEPMFVKIMGQYYEIQVQYHKLENITFVLLDAPVFRKQTKAEPYPPRMDDMESAIYYSAWNQCIAETMNRFPIDMYHINDYHGACAPLYLLPRTVPAALSLHNAEFQGMWPMRTPEESKEVCEVYNLPEQIVRDYVQFGSVFNLLHAGASYLRIHQQGFGAVGVSKKYGDRSFARYPIFWGLSKIGQLPNPDPTDNAEWDPDALATEKPTIDQSFEAGRADLKRQAQEWAGLEQNPNAELFVFVGRWSLQKGVDLIADIFPWVLEQYPQTQLICIGPMIDLYGRFAALKLAKLMEKYPTRVYSKPEFTALPPYIFSGAEFALIPSRDEPFGLVAVEFGRKGALGVGARVGGLGQMPGWWFTVESTKASHLLLQFKHAIVAALKSDTETRAQMRAYSAKQRFPVAQWLDKLEKLQKTVIKIHKKNEGKTKRNFLASTKSLLNPSKEGLTSEIQLQDRTPNWMRQVPDYDDASTMHDPSRLSTAFNTPMPSRPGTPGFDGYASGYASPRSGTPSIVWSPGHDREGSDSPTVQSFSRPFGHERAGSASPSVLSSFLPPPGLGMHNNASRMSMLSVDEVVGDRSDYKLQQVDPFFTDKEGDFYKAFEQKLGDLDSHNSISDLCIEDYLIKSEKTWFDSYRDARLGRGRGRSASPSSRGVSQDRDRSRSRSMLRLPLGGERRVSNLRNASQLSLEITAADGQREPSDSEDEYRQFEIPRDYIPPTGLKKYLQYQLGEWPIYSILLAVSQIIASNSYQITLLTGSVGQPASKLYVVASIYLGSTLIWYTLSRTMPLLYPMAVPFFFYGAAFIILGFSPFASNDVVMGWVQNVATGFYAFASSSGGIAFAFNFGTDGGSTISSWIMRLAIIQGFSQLYTLALWAWGASISAASAEGESISLATSPAMLAVCLPIALLLWAVGAMLYLGLPDFYRETPGPVPQLWKTLLKRKTIAWYLLAVVIQNYFLSSVYGRNWFFLFSSSAIPTYAVVLLALGFFVVMWCLILFVLARLSQSHPWLFPMFSVGLGAPRWAQMFWGISRIGLWLPWAGGAVASAVLSRMVWLWLGLLDGIQGAGIGMILMLTLTRVHVAAAVVGAQVLGSLATIAGRATAPDKLGPGPVFPDLSKGAGEVAGSAWFWVVLLLNLGICVGYFKFFRKEQVTKP